MLPLAHPLSDFVKNGRECVGAVFLSGVLIWGFLFHGLVTEDSVRYAAGIERIMDHGISVIPDLFNGEMCFGYYVVLSFLYKLLHQYMPLDMLMNHASGVAALGMSCSIFLLAESIFANRILAFFSVLTTLVSPTVWLLSHYGNPVIVGMSFSVASIHVFDRILRKDLAVRGEVLAWLAFIGLVIGALVVRLDILLSYGVVPGLLAFRGRWSAANLLKLAVAAAAAVGVLALLRATFLGYVVNPTGGTFAGHIATKLNLWYLHKALIKNLALWVTGANAVTVALALYGCFVAGWKGGRWLLLAAATVPYLGFLVFRVEVGRLVAPTVYLFALLAMDALVRRFRSRQALVMLAAVVLAILGNAVLGQGVARFYPVKTKYAGHPITSLPLELPVIDQYYRQRYVATVEDIAGRVALERSGNILIVDLQGGMYYRHYLEKSRSIDSIQRITCNDINLTRIATSSNVFFFYDPSNNINKKKPIAKVLECPDVNVEKVHVTPFSEQFPTKLDDLFLTDMEFARLLERDDAIVVNRSEIFQ
jgi:hypothetical protein